LLVHIIFLGSKELIRIVVDLDLFLDLQL